MTKKDNGVTRQGATPYSERARRRSYFNGVALGVLAAAVLGLYMLASTGSQGDTTAQVARYAPNPDRVIRVQKQDGIEMVNSSKKLFSVFTSQGYSLDEVRRGERAVPRLYVVSLPGDLHKMNSVQDRKIVFIKTMLPLILRANEDIRATRARLTTLRKQLEAGTALSGDDRAWLDKIFWQYRVKDDDMNVLMRRVDTVPASLALAQAAEESGWGTSRFAQEGNALFGQWTTAEGEGLVPRRREAEASHKVRVFDELHDAVAAYLHNLNTHRAYRQFRLTRAEQRAESGRLDSVALVEDLKSYSERGEDYVASIKTIIRVNRLRQLDQAAFDSPSA